MIKLRELIRWIVISFRHWYFTRIYRMDIASTARISFGTRLDKTHPRGIHIGKESYIASGAIVLSHDFCRRMRVDTHIGERCFIGANAIIMPGVTISNEVIVGSGAVVTKDVSAHSIVAGNPAKVIKKNISTGRFGQLLASDRCGFSEN